MIQTQPCEAKGPCGSPTPHAWLVAYTRRNYEGKVQNYWQERGIESFLPTYRSRRRWSDRTKILQSPLFPSYVFVRPNASEQRRAVQAPGFLWFLHNQFGPVYAAEQELDAIRRLLASGLEFDPLPGVHLGDAVEIVSGALRGCCGHLLRKDTNSVVLTVSAVNGTVRVVLPGGSSVRRLAPGGSSGQPPRWHNVLTAAS